MENLSGVNPPSSDVYVHLGMSALFDYNASARAKVSGIRTFNLGTKALSRMTKELSRKTKEVGMVLGVRAQESGTNAKAAGRYAQEVVCRANSRIAAGDDVAIFIAEVESANSAALEAALAAERCGRKIEAYLK